MLKKYATFCALSALLAQAGTIKSNAPRDIFASIRQGDIASVKAALAAGADVNSKDAEGSTPLMYAALYFNADCVRLLLDRGADPNAANQLGGTPLIWGTGSLDKVRLLVEKGADVNARSKLGKTALMVAASRDSAGPVVAYLLDHGARIDVKDELDGLPPIPLGGGANTPLIEAAKARDGQAMRMLIEKGADVNARAKNGATALLGAIAYGNRENAKLLIEKGADVEAALVVGTTPLMLSAYENDADTAALILRKGAKVDSEDAFGDTALMWAAYSDLDRPAFVKMLLNAGADLNHKNKMGETALTWAARRGDTRTTELLKSLGAVDPLSATDASSPHPAGASSPYRAGASSPYRADASSPHRADASSAHRADASSPSRADASSPHRAGDSSPYGTASVSDRSSAIDAALPLLQTSGQAVFKNAGCVSCHNNMLPSFAAGLAQTHGHAINQKALYREQKTLLSIVKPAHELLVENGDNLPDIPLTGSWALIALAAAQYAPDAATDALVHNIANKQRADGSWSNWAPRPPIQYGDIQPTALSLRALQLYPLEGRRDEFQTRIRKAANWLTQAVPASTQDEAMRLLGMGWGKADPKRIVEAARQLLSEQRPDGGWAQLPTLQSDAYATGETLYALHETGVLSTKDAAWRRGIDYLLRTQQPDGTWHVRSRAFPFQPYFESGFPYVHDQWISIAGSSWATIALLQ